MTAGRQGGIIMKIKNENEVMEFINKCVIETQVSGMFNDEIENFAYNWIFELVNDMSVIKTSYEERNASWEKFVEYAIGLERWKAQYRKVSQLVNFIGGDVLLKFETKFPQGVDSYK